MSTSKIYKFCNNSNASTNTTITLTEGSCDYDSQWVTVSGNETITYTVYKTSVTATSSVAVVGDVVVNITYHNVVVNNGTTVYDEVLADTITIPNGQTTATKVYECSRQEVLVDSNDGRMNSEYLITNDTFIVVDQALIPTCAGQPAGCTLAIVSYVITAPSQRGLTNGSIVVNVTGASGSTANNSYYLNGVLKTSTGGLTTYTYSNLSAGIYNAYVTQGDCFSAFNGLVVPEGEFRTGDFYTEKEPSDIVAANNPIINNVTTAISNPNAVQGKTKFSIVGAIANNTKIVLTLTSPFAYTQTYYAKSYPNKTNYFLASTLNNQTGVVVGSNTAAEIAVSLAQVLQNDVVVSKVYDIELSGAEVVLTAKELGSRFNLSSNNVSIVGSNLTHTIVNVGGDKYDGQLTDNYSIYMEVMAGTTQYPDLGAMSDYKKISELQMPFNVNNQHKFNLSEIVKTQIQTPQPDNNLSTVILTDPIKSFYCKLGEIYPLVANTNTLKKRFKQESGYFWAINSALDREVANDMTNWQGTLNNYTGIDFYSAVRFLSSSPVNKYITRTSQEYLYFLLPKNYGNILTLKATLYLSNGTIVYDQNVKSITTTATNAGGVCCINCSYTSLGLSSFETSTVKIMYYQLKIYQNVSGLGSIGYSEYKKYIISDNAIGFGINFQNKLGMYDSFDFIGAVEETIDRAYQVYTKPLSYTNAGGVNQGFNSKTVWYNKVTKKVVVNSGWIDSNTFNWLLELLNSKTIYSYTEQYINYLILTDFTYIKNSNEDQYNITCTFEHTIYENSVSV